MSNLSGNSSFPQFFSSENVTGLYCTRAKLMPKMGGKVLILVCSSAA